MLRSVKIFVGLAWTYFCFVKLFPHIVFTAYDTRLHAIREYGTWNLKLQTRDL